MEQEKVAKQSSPCSSYIFMFNLFRCLVVVVDGKLKVPSGSVVYFPERKFRRLIRGKVQSEPETSSELSDEGSEELRRTLMFHVQRRKDSKAGQAGQEKEGGLECEEIQAARKGKGSREWG
ncbi:uncharacterized protein LDX57_001745 [Aspergillus melleus]|uniref:uncharacterized protein n=1 Tax=Aspergillus melleus TaxID=138277 RepID=UPI001E8E6220|nr:uncharacterized protein LDX57_001745 [Aspergillus melleus]KAH8423990.1 hypothetical protein LDX57_001745 [Aspergillus melleus]